VLDQAEGRGVEPLQVVEKERERVVLASEHPHEAAEDRLEAGLRFLRGQLLHRRLPADDDLQLGDQVDAQLAVGPERRADRGDWRSRGRREVMPKPVNHTPSP